jgi:hypothetical protein
VNKTIAICIAIASFGVTVLWLRQQNPSEPSHVAVKRPVVPRSDSVVMSDPAGARAVPVRALRTNTQSVHTLSLASDTDPADRRELADYVGGLSNIAPVSVEQQRAILEAKARHRQVYDTALRDSGLEREGLSVAEREYAHRTLARALDDYRQGFLLDVKPALDDEQFALLSNYEATQFKQRLAELQIKINAK